MSKEDGEAVANFLFVFSLVGEVSLLVFILFQDVLIICSCDC